MPAGVADAHEEKTHAGRLDLGEGVLIRFGL